MRRPDEEPRRASGDDASSGEAVLRAALEVVGEALLVVGTAGRVEGWNEHLRALLPFPPGLLESRDAGRVEAFLVSCARDEDGGRTRLRRLAAAPGRAGPERVRLADERRLDVSCHALTVDGRPAGRVWRLCEPVLSPDAAEALGESEERYRSLYVRTPALMHSIDRQGRLISVSDAWLAALGYTRDEVVGRPSTDFLTPASQQYARDVVLPAYFASGACADVPYQFVRKDGSVLEVLLSAIAERAADGGIVRSLAVLVDVTQRLRVEAERDRLFAEVAAARDRAEEALALLDILLMSAPVGLVFLDRDLRYVRANPTLSGWHDATPEQDVGRTVWEASPAMAPKVVPFLRQVLETGLPVRGVELSGRSPDHPDVERSWLASYYPVRMEDGKLLGVGGVIVEVTEQKRAAALHERLLREAREAVRVRDDFLALVSHELKTPLTPLGLRLHLLEQQLRRKEPADLRHVEKARAQVDRLTTLINDLLDLSRIDAGRLSLHVAPLSLRSLVCEQVETFRLTSPQHRVDLDESDDPLVVRGDAGRLTQVVANLLDNARKYSVDGGVITVRVRREGANAHLSVQDRGIGIPPEDRGRLFDRLFRATNVSILRYGGLGLGLYIARDIVERHDGRIWVESELGAGSTFHVTLRLDDAGC